MAHRHEMTPTTAKSPSLSLMGCTVTDAAGLSQAVVLASSFLRFHPEAGFAVLLLGKPNDGIRIGNARVLHPGDLGLEAREEWRLPMLYDSRELSCLLRPSLFQMLFKEGADRVAYFASSTEIFGPLTEILEMLRLEPQVIATEALRHEGGEFGPRFMAFDRDAETSLRSWFDRLRTQSVSQEPDRKGNLELLEAGFDSVAHRVIRPSGFALGYWNLDPVTFSFTEQGYEVDGVPLRSFDFSGYDPEKPHLLSKYQGLDPRILLSEYPAIAKLCDEYRGKLVRAGYEAGKSPGGGFAFLPSGLRLDYRMRRLYREALASYQAGGEKEPPSPFGPQGESGFLKWLNEPVGQTPQPVTRYMLAVRDDREDVKQAFPDPLRADAAAFRNWYLLFGTRELDLPAAVIPPKREVNAKPGAPAAVNVAGYFRAELGLGVAARALLSALEAAGIPFNTISFDATANRLSHPFADRQADAGAADINIVCVNPDQLALFAEQTGPELRHGRYTIGVWFWEVEDFPRSFHDAFNYVDEVWVASDFMRETFLKVSPKPVFKFQLPVLTPQINPSLSRSDLGLPDGFVFLFSFDLLSVLERKNPLGLIKAFASAFPDATGPTLVIKTINGDKRCLEMEKLKYAVRGRTDIILMDGYLSQIENDTLTALSDCYVSLHRSEGFGLTLAEAMALSKPAIATAYSGNLEFMTPENSYLCPARRCQVGPEREPYPADSHWSEPDVDAAAGLLRHVYDCREEARGRGRQAARDINSFHSPAHSGAGIRDRLATIRRRRGRTESTPSIGLLEDRLEKLEAENLELRRGSRGESDQHRQNNP